MTAARAVFIDTNILVYAIFENAPWHEMARDRLAELERQTATLWISRQIVREFLATATRPGVLTPLPPAAFLARLAGQFEGRFQFAEDDREVTALLLELLDNPGARGRQVHDANIVATMRRYGIPILLTHNTADSRDAGHGSRCRSSRRCAPAFSVLPMRRCRGVRGRCLFAAPAPPVVEAPLPEPVQSVIQNTTNRRPAVLLRVRRTFGSKAGLFTTLTRRAGT